MATNPFLDVLRLQMQMQAQRRLQQDQIQAQQELARAQMEQERQLRQQELEQLAPVRQATAQAQEAQAAAAKEAAEATRTQRQIAAAQQHMEMLARGAVPAEGGSSVKIRTPDGVEYVANPEALVQMDILKAQTESMAQLRVMDMQMQMWGFDPQNESHRGIFSTITNAVKPQPGVSPEVHLGMVEGALTGLQALGDDPKREPLRRMFEQQAKVLKEQLDADRRLRMAAAASRNERDEILGYVQTLLGTLAPEAVTVNRGDRKSVANVRYQIGQNLNALIANPEELGKKMDEAGIPKDPGLRQRIIGALTMQSTSMLQGDVVDSGMRPQ